MHARGLITCLVLFAAGLCLTAGAWLTPRLVRMRAAENLETTTMLDQTDEVADFQIPTAALFTFRSLAIDYLWTRVNDLQSTGQYFDALYLSRLICKLQPHLGAIWDFQGWNMAYNISVAMPTAQERWDWIAAAIELLRDEGLQFNPSDTKIYTSLAMIFQHKIGWIADDYHRFYKLKLAYEMAAILGNGPLGHEAFERMVQADLDADALMADPNMVHMIDAIRTAAPQLTDTQDVQQFVRQYSAGLGRYDPALVAFMNAHQNDPWMLRLLDCSRAAALRQQWKMDPARMERLNRQYGPIDYTDPNVHEPLDWRLPYAHAMYWADRGLEHCTMEDFDYLRLRRLIYQSAMNMYRFGHLQLYMAAPPRRPERLEGQEVVDRPDKLSFQLQSYVSQDLRMFPSAHAAMAKMIQDYIEAPGDPDNPYKVPYGAIDGLVTLTRNGVVSLYLAGHTRLANEYYQWILTNFPTRDDFKIPLETFVRNRLLLEMSDVTPTFSTSYINGMLRDAFYRYAMGDPEQAAIRSNHARQLYDQVSETYADQGERTAMPVWSKMRGLAMKDFLDDPAMSDQVKALFMNRISMDYPDEYQSLVEYLKNKAASKQDGADGP